MFGCACMRLCEAVMVAGGGDHGGSSGYGGGNGGRFGSGSSRAVCMLSV